MADGNEPELTNLLDPKADEEIIVEQDFNWWLTEEHQDNPQVAATLRRANDSVLPSEKVRADIKGAAWWIDPGERAHIRWVRPEDENELLNALARVHAAGELNLGEGSKFAGVFRTHGVMVPVWDLDNSWEPQTWQKGLEALDKKIAEALANDSGRFSPEEQKAKRRSCPARSRSLIPARAGADGSLRGVRSARCACYPSSVGSRRARQSQRVLTQAAEQLLGGGLVPE